MNKESSLYETFTITELNKAKELSYANWEKNLNDEDTEIGFEYKGQWISNPFVEESGRFEFVDYECMCEHYGMENIINFIKKILETQ